MPQLKEQINGWIGEEIKFPQNVQLSEKVADKLNENEDNPYVIICSKAGHAIAVVDN